MDCWCDCSYIPWNVQELTFRQYRKDQRCTRISYSWNQLYLLFLLQMTRDIKFRVRFKPDQKMFDVTSLIRMSDEKELRVFPKTSITLQDGVLNRSTEDWEIELMQFTWLFDKNGKEIYEWDIVKRDDQSNGKYRRFAVVELDPDIQFNCSSINEIAWIKNSADCVFRYGHFAYKDTENHLTIIGNIYENPELINA